MEVIDREEPLEITSKEREPTRIYIQKVVLISSYCIVVVDS